MFPFFFVNLFAVNLLSLTLYHYAACLYIHHLYITMFMHTNNLVITCHMPSIYLLSTHNQLRCACVCIDKRPLTIRLRDSRNASSPIVHLHKGCQVWLPSSSLFLWIKKLKLSGFITLLCLNFTERSYLA